MDPIDINYLLHKNKTSQAEIARKLRITKQTVNQIVQGKRRSKRVMKAIAKAVGKKVNEIWPAA